MAWTASNPVTIGNPTKKSDYDNAWDNIDFLKGGLWLHNLGLAASVSSKALTVALKGADGNNASASNPVTIGFRSATLTTGTPVFRTVTGALSVVLSSGSTLGFTAALAGRIYVWAIDNAGTVVLGLSRTADIFPESNLVSTTAEGGAGAADSAAVMYSAATQTSKAVRCIGYIEITTGATAGEWDNAPTKIQVMGPGVKRTGEIAHFQNAILTATQDISQDTWTAITNLAINITPKSVCNKVLLRAVIAAGSPGASTFSARFCVGGSVIIGSVGASPGNRVASAAATYIYYANSLFSFPVDFLHSPAAITEQAYTLEVYLGDKVGHINKSNADADNDSYGRTISTFTAIEIEA